MRRNSLTDGRFLQRQTNAAGKPLYQTAKPKPAPKPLAFHTGPAWWAAHAAPDLPRESFSNAARARNAAMHSSYEWTRTTNLHQLKT